MTGPTRIDIHELLEQREWLQRLACRLLGVGPDADDLTQETLARALAAPAPRAFSRAWLARIARNLFAERRRSEAGRRSREEVAARPEATGDSDAVDRADLQRVLLEAVLRLEEPSRTAVILRYLEGQSYEDIALRQKASVPAIRKRVSRAIELLKIELDEHSGGRREWGVVLLPILGVKLPEVSPAIPAATLPSVLTGVLAMSTKSKLAASLAALVLIGAFVVPALITPRSRTSEVQPGTVAQVLPTATVLDGGASQNDRVTVTNERTDEVEPRKTSVLAFPVQPRSTVGTLELRLEWPDGSPADGVVARIVPWGTDAFLYRREVRSGPQGIALVEQLAPGLVGVYLDRGWRPAERAYSRFKSNPASPQRAASLTQTGMSFSMPRSVSRTMEIYGRGMLLGPAAPRVSMRFETCQAHDTCPRDIKAWRHPHSTRSQATQETSSNSTCN